MNLSWKMSHILNERGGKDERAVLSSGLNKKEKENLMTLSIKNPCTYVSFFSATDRRSHSFYYLNLIIVHRWIH